MNMSGKLPFARQKRTDPPADWEGLFFFFVPQNVGDLAVEGGAEGVEGLCRHGLALLDPMDGVRGKAQLVDQMVLRDPLAVQGLKKRSIADQFASPKKVYHISALDYA